MPSEPEDLCPRLAHKHFSADSAPTAHAALAPCILQRCSKAGRQDQFKFIVRFIGCLAPEAATAGSARLGAFLE